MGARAGRVREGPEARGDGSSQYATKLAHSSLPSDSPRRPPVATPQLCLLVTPLEAQDRKPAEGSAEGWQEGDPGAAGAGGSAG